MASESDRLARAGRYVLGQMDDADRERAERDLEFDPKFRAAVVAVAELMHLFDLGAAAKEPEANWQVVATKIAALPHMSETSRDVVENAASGDRQRTAGAPSQRMSFGGPNPALGWQIARRTVIIAVALAIGYAIGVWSVSP
jgi:anti-sigma-K factor RskA